MVTDDRTFHGFKKMSLPAEVTRKSIATYAYEKVPEGSVNARTTGWAPEEGGALKQALAKHYDSLVHVKTEIFRQRHCKESLTRGRRWALLRLWLGSRWAIIRPRSRAIMNLLCSSCEPYPVAALHRNLSLQPELIE